MVFRWSALAAISILASSLSPNSFGQAFPLPKDPWTQPNTGKIETFNSEGATLVLSVYNDLRGLLDRQAMVKLSNPTTKMVVWQTTQDKSATTFGDLPLGTYDLEVSAVGYLPEHQALEVRRELYVYHLDVALRKDPASIEFPASTNSDVPAKVRKQIDRAVTSLKSGDLKRAQDQLAKAYQNAPSSSDVNFLLGYVSFQKNQFGDAQGYLSKAAQLDSHNVEALTLLGRLHLQQENYPLAKTVLQQAAAANPRNWIVHSLLADTCLHLREYQEARDQAEQAIEEARGQDYSGEIVLGEALANLGHRVEALRAFQTFLEKSPRSPTAPRVRELMTQLEASNVLASNDLFSPEMTGLRSAIDPIPAASVLVLRPNAWEPPGIDDVRPPVASGMKCPAQEVIDGASQRVKQLVDDISRFVAIEELIHEDLDDFGNPVTKVTRTYNYTASISEQQKGYLGVEEYRLGSESSSELAGITTRGLPALALVFHPAMRDNFELSCEGLGQWQGKAAWLVHFRQRADRPNRMQAYKIGYQSYPVDLKGRAWILSESFQIARIESQLIEPVPDIQLLGQQQIVDYGPVPFPKKHVELWLPKSAELYFDLRRHRYYRRHSFDHFMLFSVDSTENTPLPK
jgi:tetratricopeptide (TPR) repeat protein